MKILYVITQLGVGGAEVVLVSMAHKMIELGHQVEIVSLLNINKQEFKKEINVHILDLKNHPLKSSIKFGQIIRKFNPDVVHSHCLHANIITRIYRLFYSMKKLVTTAHNTYEGQGLVMSIFKHTNFLSDIITNVSRDAVNAFEKNKYIKLNQMKVMFNVIDINKFKFSASLREIYRNKFNIGSDELILIAVGSMKDSKDYPNLLKAIKLLKEKQSHRFRLFIVGDGLLLKDMKSLAFQLKLDEDVFFLGNRNDVGALLSMADIFILSSKHEGLPTVLVEAAMSQNVIVSTDCGGIDDLLPTRENIVTTNDPDALANKVFEVMNWEDCKKLEHLNGVYKFISDNLDPEVVSRRWLDIYLESYN